MGDLGEIGWYLKLENQNANTKGNSGFRKDKEKERVRQPLFQFRYDAFSGKFIRELKESLFTDTATKNPNFINGKWVDFTNDGDDQITSPNPKSISPLVGDDDKSGMDVEDIKFEIEDKSEVVKKESSN